MELKNYFAQDAEGNAQPYASCYLYSADTSNLINGLVDAANQPLTNPFVSDSYGLIQFKAPNGIYDLRVISGNRDYKIRVQAADVTELIDGIDEAVAAADTATTAAELSQSKADIAATAATNAVDARDDAESYAVDVLSSVTEVNNNRILAQQAALDAGNAAEIKVQQLEVKLANPVNGVGLLGLDPTFNYPLNTLGAATSVIDARYFGFLADGSDETTKLQSAALKLKDTGLTLLISKGTIGITATTVIQGFTLRMRNGTSIKVMGDSQTAFVNGGLRILPGGEVYGTVYTSGSMVAAFGSGFASRPAAVYVDGGKFEGSAYSQMYGAIKYSSGELDAKTWGGVYGAVQAELVTDIPYRLKVSYYNAGVAYKDKQPFSYVIADCRAVYVRVPQTVTSPIELDINGGYSTKNGLWVQGDGTVSGGQIEHLILKGNITRAGYYKDAAGVTQLGHGAGTCLEVLNAPDFQSSINTRYPQGYNVAIASGSHGSQVSGLHIGNGGDPVIVIVNTNQASITGELRRGTVGVSVGEDGSAANGTKISAVIRDMTAAPILFDTGIGLEVSGCTISGEPTLGSYTGAWTGPGEVRAAVVVRTVNANDVVMSNNSINGWFTHDIIDRSTVSGRLRVTRTGPAYAAPIMVRDDVYMNKFNQQGLGCKYIRMLDDSDATGHAGVGELNVPASGPSFVAATLSPSMRNLTDFDVTGATLAEIRSKYAVLVYMKYTPDALGKRIAFNLQVGGGTVHAQAIFYGVFGDPTTPVANSIGGVLHPLTVGEWVPLIMSLDSVIYTGSDPATLTHFLVYKMDGPTTYDLTITKPVLVYVGNPQKAP